MKKIIVLVAVFGIFSLQLLAQKYAYVDTEYILDNIPEYADAQKELDDLAVEFQEEIEAKYAEIDKIYRDFQAEAVLLPEDIKKKKEEDIIDKEKEVKELQTKRFGPTGDLFQKREELVKPIQEKIYNAIEEISEDKNYAFVFDKAGSLTILYVNVKFDISDDVLDKVGAELGTVRREDRKRNNQPPPASTPKNNNENRNRSPGGMNPGGSIRK